MGKEIKKDLIVGLDIGTSKVAALVAEVADDGALNVIGLGTHPSRGRRRVSWSTSTRRWRRSSASWRKPS